jgi:hypothetical protein
MTPNKAAFHLGKAVNGLRTKPNPNQTKSKSIHYTTPLQKPNQTKPKYSSIHPKLLHYSAIAALFDTIADLAQIAGNAIGRYPHR